MRQFVARLIVVAVSFALTAPPALAQSSELPTLGEAASDDLSPANERKLGEAIMREVRRDPSYLPDAETTEYLNAVGYQLVAASPARHMDFSFFAVRDSMLNAFALPGGYIGVHSGLVLAAQSESELAAVLAHEIGHVDQRHIARMLAQQRQTSAIAIGALLLALLAARSNSSSSGDLTQAAIAGSQAAMLQQRLNFSREAEREADRVGLQTLVAAGFDARAMVTFFGKMQQASRVYESAAPSYLRTHPLTVERISDIQARLKETRTKQRADSLDFLLVRARLRVLQEDSMQGTRDAADFFRGQIANRTSQSDAATQYGLAVASLRLNQPQAGLDYALAARKATRAPSAILDKVVSEAKFALATAAGDTAGRDEAVRQAQDATQRFPLSRLTTQHYVTLLQASGRHQAAIDYLREQLAVPRTDPNYHAALARSYTALNRRTLQHQAVAEMYALLGALPSAVDQLQMARKAADADFYVMSEVDARLRELTRQMKENAEEMLKSGRRPPPDDERRK
jgi:predicted Zn-dependent protease